MGTFGSSAVLAYGVFIPESLYEKAAAADWEKDLPKEDYLPYIYDFEDSFEKKWGKDFFYLNVEWCPGEGILLYSTKSSTFDGKILTNPKTKVEFNEHVGLLGEIERLVGLLGLEKCYKPEENKVSIVPTWLLVSKLFGPS